MANKEFVAVTWSPSQLIDEDTLDQINANLIYLRDQSVDGKYMNSLDGVTSVGIKLLCGRKTISPVKSDTVSALVGFAKMFTANSYPIVTTSLTSPSGKVKFHHIIHGIDRDHPNHQGFSVKINLAHENVKQDIIDKPIYVNWIAMGY